MNTKAIYDYLDELSRCEWDAMADISSCSYNGFSISEGPGIYQQKLKSMQRVAEEALLDLLIAGQQQALNAFHDKAKDISEQVDDVITPEYVEGLRTDARGRSRTRKIQDEIDKGQFIVEMHGIQCYFRNELLNFISRLKKDAPMAVTVPVITVPTQTQTPATVTDSEIPTQTHGEDSEKRLLYGVREFGKFLGIGTTNASHIAKSEILPKDIQYKVGKVWIFNAKKLEKYLAEHPEALSMTVNKS